MTLPELLSDLPVEHPLRNTPLLEINAFFQYDHEKKKNVIKPSWKIAQNTYNELGPAWTDHNTWYGGPYGTDH